MPYTPPAPHSPASSTTPTSSHSQHQFDSYHGHRRHLPRSSSGSSLTSLPRSRSSSTTSRKRHEEEAKLNTEANKAHQEDHEQQKQRLQIDTTWRQSPRPVTDSSMPAGAIMSPPDSGLNSSDDEQARDIKELTKAVRQSLQINRTGSPELDQTFIFPPKADREEQHAQPADGKKQDTAPADSEEQHAEPTTGEEQEATPADKLADTARKITHSRSTTDTAVVLTPADSPANTSGDGSEDDLGKPPLIRKKSGELVKPAIRPKNRRTFSSMPGTPTYGKKGVHFNDDIQQVKHFLQVDRPIAVSAGGSPVENYEDDNEFPFTRQPPSPTHAGFDIRLSNFPRESLERQSQLVRVDKINASADRRSLLGQIVVANLAFHKTVVVRFTFDFWKTTSEVLGEYCSDPLLKPRDGYDMFNFSIKLTDISNIENKTMFICVRYQVDGKEYWDNNSSMNFQVDFTKRQNAASAAPGSGARPIPRSRKGSVAPAKVKHQPSFDEDFSRGFESGPPLKLKQKQPVRNTDFPQPRQPARNSQQFGSRYDFGASLTAALNQAQSSLGDRSGVKRGQQQASPPQSSLLQRRDPSPRENQETPHADALHANKPSTDSRAYQDFVSRFCFFGSGKPSSPSTSQHVSPSQAPKRQPASGTDGTHDEKPPIPERSPQHSVIAQTANLTLSPRMHASDGPNSSPRFLPRTGSPPQETLVEYGSRSSSPASMGYRVPQPFDHGLISSGTATPQTAIHG